MSDCRRPFRSVLRAPSAVLVLLIALGSLPLSAAESGVPPLLPEVTLQALASEVSGAAAKRTAQELTLFHRMRGSRGFRAAAERVRDKLRDFGLSDVEIVSLPADGKIFYGTQRSRPAWDVDFAELWEQRPGEGGTWIDQARVASFEAEPITLAQDSAGGTVTADLVDVGAGTAETDYAGKDVKGRLVLISSQPGGAYPLAVDKYGAAGLVSYAQNQPTAWSKDDDSLIRWGHLDTFPAPKTFAFMVSLKRARRWQERLAAGGTVHLRAEVRAGQHAGSYDIATAVLPGLTRAEEIVLSCHLDHQCPGANDNASGCSAILEVARTLSKLVREKRIPQPRRTIRFVFPPEVEGTIALLNARPALPEHAKAVIHMDMVGGEVATTKAVFHLTRSPKSLPTVANEVAEAFGRFVNDQTYDYAATGRADYPLVDPEGTKEPLLAQFVDYTPGSDHEVWTEGSFRVPAIYFNDWPDRYIHTHADSIAHLDPTKLLRAAFLGAASATYLANLEEAQVPDLWQVVKRQSLIRAGEAMARCDRLPAATRAEECDNLLALEMETEAGTFGSIERFAPIPKSECCSYLPYAGHLSALLDVSAIAIEGGEEPADSPGLRVYRRSAAPKGPMTGFGYSYLGEQLEQRKLPRPALLQREGIWGGGADYAYEALNWVDGKRRVRDIQRALAAEYGPLPEAEVAEFLETLKAIGVLER